MRFVNALSDETISLLNRAYQDSKFYRVRQRAHCILLSHRGYPVTTLMKIFNVTQVTIYHWMEAWETQHFVGLYDRKGKGCKSQLTPTQKKQVKTWAKAYPKQLGKIVGFVQSEFEVVIGKRTIQRILKGFHFSWRRVRRAPNGQPDPTLYQLKKQELETFKEQEEQGLLDLYYYDESGFCLSPYVPYAWQEKGQTIALESSSHGQRLNVLGFLNRNHLLNAYTTESGVNSEVVVACFDDFSQKLTKKTIVVIDQASFHKSQVFTAQIPLWQEKGLEIFYLPPYSPELNVIEILWRFMKYEWIEFAAYKSWNHLVQYVDKIITNYGTQEYQINFG